MATQVSGIIEQIQPSGSSGTKYAIASTAYGYCQTAANQKAKTVDMTGFELIKGVTIHVKFQYNNTAASPTLNVNGTGALNIVQYGTTAAGTTDETTSWYAGAVVSFTYDGTSWVRDQGFNTNTTYTFENGTNGFKVTPLGGTAQTVTVTPSITNNITGTGTANYLTKFIGANTIGATGIAIDSNNNLTIPSTLIKFTALGEGLELSQNNDYFGTNYDARIISIIDSNPGTGSTAVDGGLIVQAVGRVSNTDTIQELLRIRNHNGSANWITGEFQWKTKDIVVEVGASSKTWDITANTSSKVTITTHTNTTNGNKYYYLPFLTATSGNLSPRAHSAVYLYETVENGVISKYEFCFGASTIKGSITLWDGSSHWGNIAVTDLSANRLYTLPNEGGTIALITQTDTNALINTLSTGSSPLTANDYVITQYVGGGTTTTTYHRRPASLVVNSTLVKAALGTVNTTAKKFLKDTGDWTQVDWGDLTNIPSTFTPSSHEHNYIGKDHYIAYPSDGTYDGNGTVTGYIKIRIPETKSATMFSFDVDIYNYVGDTTTRYHIAGYNYNNASWNNCTAYCIAPLSNAKANLSVRFLSNGNDEMYVTIGETNTSWSYPKVTVHNITLGHSNSTLAKWKTGWTTIISNTAFETTQIKQTITNTNIAIQADIANKTAAANLTTTVNAIAYYTNTTGTFSSKASADGALYATSTNGSLQWGTLPIAQGGTGKTTANDAANALISGLPTWTASPTADTYFIRRDTGGTAAFGQVKFSSIANITNGVITLGPYSITPVTSVNGHTGSSVNVTAGDLGLSSALRYQGTTTTAMEDGRTTAAVTIGGNSFTPTQGDVVIYNDAEYVWTGSLWELLGAESSFKKVQTAVNSSSASGSSATTFVSSVTQDTQGVITVKTSTLDTSGDWSGNAATATRLKHLSLDNTTINNTSGSFAFSGSGNPWSGTDWVGLQIGDSVDKFQISAGGAGTNSLLFRQNDSGGTNTSWQTWQVIAHAANAVGGAKIPIYMSADGTLAAGDTLKALAYKDSLTYSDVGAAPSSHNHDSAYVPIRNSNNSYSFNKGAYVGGTAKKYAKVTLPDSFATIWGMYFIELSLRYDWQNCKGGKILINTYHNSTSPYTWLAFNAELLGNFGSEVKIYGSDGKYLYIQPTTNGTTYSTISVDKVLVGDTAGGYDLSALTIEWTDTLPETHQEATIYYGVMETGTDKIWNIGASYASNAARINGNLGALTDTSQHNIWVSSTNAADGIPKYVSGVYVTASTGVITAKGFSGPLSGNATSATKIAITTAAPTASKIVGYIPFSAAITGNNDLYAQDSLYLYDTVTSSAISAVYLNVGKSQIMGGITLHSATNANAHGNLVPATITANTTRTWTLPNATGTIALTSSNVTSADSAKWLMNRGTNVTIGDSSWAHGITGRGGTNTSGGTVWKQKWTQSGLTYTPSGGSATALSDSGDLVIWLSQDTTSNNLWANMAIDGYVYSLSGFRGGGLLVGKSEINQNVAAGANSDLLRITNTRPAANIAANNWFWGTDFVVTNMIANTNACHVFGKANSTRNSGVLNYHHAGDASNDNYVGLGLYGVEDILTTYANRTVQVNGKLCLNRVGSTSYGRISYYKSNYVTWFTYMSDTANGAAPTGGKPGTLGNITSWGLRTLIENASGYGWLWEAAANSAASANTVEPTVRMGLSSNTGQLRIAPNASSSSLESGGLIIDGAKNASSGNVAIELWRGGNASWQIANEGGNLYIRNNWTTTKQTTYNRTSITVNYNTGNTTFAGSVTATGGFSGDLSGNATSASKIAAKIDYTNKSYVLGTQDTINTTSSNVSLTGGTGVYLTTTPGELSVYRYSWHYGSAERAYSLWNDTDQSIDFVFI